MPRPEYALAVFGMCIGFIASVGIGNALATNLLNPWLLFLATDIIGAICPKKWLAAVAGAAWGVLCLVGISGINAVLTFMPVDLIGALGQLGTYIVTGFALFPVVAIIMQFGWQRGIITAVLAVVARVFGPMLTFGPTQASISADAWTLLVGVIMLVAVVAVALFVGKPTPETFVLLGAIVLTCRGPHPDGCRQRAFPRHQLHSAHCSDRYHDGRLWRCWLYFCLCCGLPVPQPHCRCRPGSCHHLR